MEGLRFFRWPLLLLLGCSQTPTPQPDAGADAGTGCAVTNMQSWPEADALFQNDPAWIGSDAAYSVDLGAARVLWLFGDTFIAKDASRSRSNAWFIRNSVAIQAGYDPSSATATFAWQTGSSGASSFFPESGANWFWPLGGIRLPTRLVLFLLEEEATTTGLGFQAVSTKVVFITNADADPSSWVVTDGNLPTFSFPIAFGAAVASDGTFVYAFGDEEPGDHSVYVARFDAATLDSGDASQVSFWTNGAWAPPTSSPPDVIFPSSSSLDNPPTELSVQARADGGWLAVHSVGYGATSIAVRTAPAPQGLWSGPCVAFTPPESGMPNVLVYAAKGHPELTGAPFIATYATNSTDLSTLVSDMSLYFPRFVTGN